MKKRDSNGRFLKNGTEDGTHLTFDIPSLKNIIIWIFIIFIIFPWILIISKLNIFQKMESFFDLLLKEKYEEVTEKEVPENGKKSGLFY